MSNKNLKDMGKELAQPVVELIADLIAQHDAAILEEAHSREVKLKTEISRLDAVLERLGDEKVMYGSDINPAPGHHAIFDVKARIQYAIDNRINAAEKAIVDGESLSIRGTDGHKPEGEE